jgi:hypothetical protein
MKVDKKFYFLSKPPKITFRIPNLQIPIKPVGNIRKLKNCFFLYRLVENFILRKNPKKKFSEFYRLPLQSGFAGSPNFSKKTFFYIFQKVRASKTYFKQVHSYHKKQYYYLKFWLISIIYADFVAVLV